MGAHLVARVPEGSETRSGELAPARQVVRTLAAALGLVLSAGCGGVSESPRPSIQLTQVPPADPGGPDTLVTIEGRVEGASPGQRVVLFNKSGVWWVQPGAGEPYTEIGADATFRNATHLGTEYAALLVEADYEPPARADTLPEPGGGVIAVMAVPGTAATGPVHRTLSFGGYEWIVRGAPSDRGGRNQYDPDNAWTDDQGALHLRIAAAGDDWTCAEVALTRRMGYGTYVVTIHDVSHLDPAAVFTLFTWDGPAVEQNHRELDLEISRWGDPAVQNAQYVVQPYYVPTNVSGFEAPAGVLTHSLTWEPGRASFRTVRGPSASDGALVSEHVFTSGVPSPGNERLRLNLYVFRRGAQPLESPTEVVVEKFEYFP
jgi:hypothetical protein